MHPYALWKKWIRVTKRRERIYYTINSNCTHLVESYESENYGYMITTSLIMRKPPSSFYNLIKSNYYTQRDYVLDVGRRWKRWARKRVESRAANTIRNFYYDYVIPRVYNPHTRGEGYLRLEAKMREINCD